MSSGFSPAVLLVLSIVTAGYIIATHCYRFRYQTARESGHRLYLTCAVLGGLMTFLSVALLAALAGGLWLFESLCGVQAFPGVMPENLLSTASILNIPLALLASRLYNRRPGVKAKNLSRAWQKDDFSSLLSYAIHNEKLVAVTLANRKVYIGLVARTNEPQWESAHVTLLPFYSGYREEKVLRLEITNTYDEVFDYFSCQQSGEQSVFAVEDFYVVIPLSEIVSSHVFNPEIFQRIYDGRVKERLMSQLPSALT